MNYSETIKLMRPSAEKVEVGLIVAAGAVAAGAVLYEGSKLFRERVEDHEPQQPEAPAEEHIILDNSTNSGNFNFGDLSPQYSS